MKKEYNCDNAQRRNPMQMGLYMGFWDFSVYYKDISLFKVVVFFTVSIITYNFKKVEDSTHQFNKLC